MTSQWQIVIKPAFLHDINALQSKEVAQVMEKVMMLTQNPVPDGKVKKQLTHLPSKPCRIRSGDYRIFYAFNQQVVSVFKIERRNEDTYKEEAAVYVADDLGDMAEMALGDVDLTQGCAHPWERNYTAVPLGKPFPEPITIELLNRLRIPTQYHKRLLPLKTQDELLVAQGLTRRRSYRSTNICLSTRWPGHAAARSCPGKSR